MYGKTGGSSKRDGLKFGGVAEWREAMDVDWMSARELAQAVPPAYTRFLAEEFLRRGPVSPTADLALNNLR